MARGWEPVELSRAEPLIRTEARGAGPRLRSIVLALCLLAGAIVAGCTSPPAPVPTAAPTPIPPTVMPSPTDALPTEIPLPTAVPSETPAPATPTVENTATPVLSPTAIATPLGMLAAIGVMIDNDPSARPQSGLNAADVVYEVVAEFDLTRFLAIYFANAPTNVGSIRSTRPYFAMAMTDYGGGLIHCQDVPGAAEILTQGTTFNYDLCRGSGEEAATRITSRIAPFNLYVNARMLADELNQHPPRSAPPLLARAPLAAGGSSATHIEIAHPDPHVITWDWNGSVYLRQQDGERHLDASGDQISTDVIVIQQAEEEPTRFFGEAGYHIVGLTGSGDGTVLAGGSSARIRWSRAGVTSSTVFVDAKGDPFLLPPGRVFFEVIPPDAPVTMKA